MPTPYGEFVPDPLSPSGYRWKRHDEPEPTGLLPAVEQPAQMPAVHPEQDDLSAYDDDPDLEIVPTEKLGLLDEVLIQPPQEPDWHNPREVS